MGLAFAAVLHAALGPVAALLLQLWTGVGGALLPLAQLLRNLVAGPFLLLGSGLRQLGAASGEATRQLGVQPGRPPAAPPTTSLQHF